MRLLIVLIFLAPLNSSYCQQVLYKKHRLGYTLGAGFNFNTSRSKIMSLSNNQTIAYSLGFTYEFQINMPLAIRSGININYSSAKFKDSNDDTYLYYYSETPFLFRDSPMNFDELKAYPYKDIKNAQFDSRDYRFGYISIPLTLLLRTRMTNFKRYYLKLGGEFNIRLRSNAKEDYYRFTDTLNNYSIATTKLKIRDMNHFKFGAVVGVGLEKNYVGKRSIYIDIEGIIALNNTFSQNQNEATILTNSSINEIPEVAEIKNDNEFMLNHLWQHQLILKIGFLF